jgi:uncharacterized phage infection (PIP) family protein YhgE
MNSDEKILKILEDVQANIKALHAGQKNLEAGQKNLQADVTSIKNVQQKHGERLEVLESGQKELKAKVDNVELKAEAIHAYQLKAHDEILGIMHDTTEINGQEQKELEKRVEVLEEHAGIPHPDKN